MVLRVSAAHDINFHGTEDLELEGIGPACFRFGPISHKLNAHGLDFRNSNSEASG